MFPELWVAEVDITYPFIAKNYSWELMISYSQIFDQLGASA